MNRTSVHLVCPTCKALFRVLEDEAVKDMECIKCMLEDVKAEEQAKK